jgi:serpin B
MVRFYLLLTIIVVTSCNKSVGPEPVLDIEMHQDDLEFGVNNFQWLLFQEVIKTQKTAENINISPWSIATSLFMTLRGASGDTRKKMEETVQLPNEAFEYEIGAAFADISEDLKPNTIEIKSSNAIFWDKDRVEPDAEFLSYLNEYYEAAQFELTFLEPSALETINDWVKKETGERIDKIIDQINPEEIMFVLNALYFKADWQYPFPLESTRASTFKKADGTEIETPFMYQDIDQIRSFRDDQLSAVELPFADGTYSLLVILPAQDKTPDQLIAALSVDRLSTLFKDDLKTGRILLDLPRFEIEYKISLIEALKSLGMDIAFDPQRADFSRIGQAPGGNLFLTKVDHKTYLKIDEKGAEGAAVTSVGVGVTSVPPTFRFDRPFVFILRNNATGVFIFAGKIESLSS